MRSLFNQIIAASWAAILSLPARLGASAVAVFGTACVVGVFIGVLSMAAGLERSKLFDWDLAATRPTSCSRPS